MGQEGKSGRKRQRKTSPEGKGGRKPRESVGTHSGAAQKSRTGPLKRWEPRALRSAAWQAAAQTGDNV